MLSAIPPKAGRTASGRVVSGYAIKAVGLFLLAARHSKQACSALAPQRRFPAGSCESTSLTGRPDSHARSVWASCLYSWLCTGGGNTIPPRPNFLSSAACRAVPAWLLCHLCQSAASADAEATACPKQHRLTILTHAPTSCRKSPTSHARPGVQE